ncbi:MAG: DNA G/T mismatch repair endonuclease [Parcubacteria group bacterium Gr01-1014_13]|nr:MAG: DNA G/T mismatch repair endonuclease [Parcubacteria group bacterium Gr01-1014_13]
MVDVHTKEQRSRNMAAIKSRNTGLEVIVFKILKNRKVYFQKHYKGITGSPDIALPRKKIAIFIDGDFWHGYNFAKLKRRLPKKFWIQKIENNIKRDKAVRLKLKKDGWKIMRIWEHEIKKKLLQTLDKIEDFLKNIK